VTFSPYSDNISSTFRLGLRNLINDRLVLNDIPDRFPLIIFIIIIYLSFLFLVAVVTLLAMKFFIQYFGHFPPITYVTYFFSIVSKEIHFSSFYVCMLINFISIYKRTS
jgi:hypothetical protein